MVVDGCSHDTSRISGDDVAAERRGDGDVAMVKAGECRAMSGQSCVEQEGVATDGSAGKGFKVTRI